MDIDIFGGIFVDVYRYRKRGRIKVIESIGGSGLNIALGLHILGHRVRLHGNIGDDNRGKRIVERLKEYKFPMEYIDIKKGYTGIFISENDKVYKVFRGVNDMEIKYKTFKENDVVILTTEISYKSIYHAINNRWRKIFFDVGPRPSLIEEMKLLRKTIKIGNNIENKVVECDIIKQGPQGARWGKYYSKGNRIKYSHTIGAGDLFDTVLIHSYLMGKEKKKALNNAVEISEKSCRIKGGFESKIMGLKNQLIYN